MRHVAILTRSLSLLALCVLAQPVSVSAANPLDCSKESLAASDDVRHPCRSSDSDLRDGDV